MGTKPARTRVWAKLTSVVSPEPSKTRTTPPPSREQQLQEENWRLHQLNEWLEHNLRNYNDAVRSIVMRLKVLDIEKLKEEMGEDGTIPMRMMLREMAALVKAYEGESSGGSATCTPGITPSEEPF